MDEKERTLYCGNLSDRVTEDILYELFLQAGPLEGVSIPKDKDGRRRNFGFVTFKHSVSVQYSLALMYGVTLYGKPLKLDARTGAGPERNPYLETLQMHKKSFSYPENYDRGYSEMHDNRGYGYDRRDQFVGDRSTLESRMYSNEMPVEYPSYRQRQSYNSNSHLEDTQRAPFRASAGFRSRMNESSSPWRSNYY